MKIQPECLPCLLKRILFESELSTHDKKKQTQALRTACTLLAKYYNPTTCSATIATKIHKRVYTILQDNDPYKTLKHTSNRIALSLTPKIETLIRTSADPLKTSMICSIIANIMDFGISGSTTHPQMLERVFDRLYAEGLGYDDSQSLKKHLKNATHIMVFTDNCGEIIFDKLLCKELKHFNPTLHITVVVKGEPVLCDATAQDAKEISLYDIVEAVYTTGCFAVGVDFHRLPKEVTSALNHTNLIIAKGMANYESFSETSFKPIAYLLRTKCTAIARSMNLPENISAIKLYT